MYWHRRSNRHFTDTSIPGALMSIPPFEPGRGRPAPDLELLAPDLWGSLADNSAICFRSAANCCNWAGAEKREHFL